MLSVQNILQRDIDQRSDYEFLSARELVLGDIGGFVTTT